MLTNKPRGFELVLTKEPGCEPVLTNEPGVLKRSRYVQMSRGC